MGTIGEIGGDELVLDVDETIFVAVAEDVEKSKTTVLWAARNFSGKKICLLYVHRTARAASWTHKKLIGGSFKKHDVKVIERVEKPKVDELMNSYLHLLSDTEVQTDRLCIAGQNVEEGIVELIARYKIKWLVMGAASDKHYSWKMTDLKSKKAIFVCKKAPDSCHIWFLCKGYLIFTRASNEDSNNRQTMPPLVQLDSDNETRKSEKLESSYMRRRLRYWRSLLEQDGEKDTGQLEREKVEPRPTPRFSSGSSSSFGEAVGPEPVSPELVDSDTLSTSNVEEKEREGDVARKVHRYDKAMHDIGQSERTVYGEAGNKWKEDASTTEALCKAKALEGLCIKESSQRKKLEELLEKEKHEVKTVIEQNNGFMKELQMVQGQNFKLDSQLRKLRDLEKEHGEKFDTAMELLKSFRQKRDEIRIDHENAIKEVKALRRLIKGETGNSSGSQMLEYSFMEINEATNEFDQSWKLGEGKYGSVYKGNLQHLQVAVKMLPSYGSLNNFEFERRVEILSRVRHPNLITLMGACPESRSLIYQYIPNGSLEDCFSSENNVPALSWESRIRIASEICSALLFLHSNIPCIIHGNLKPSKILLDSNLVTKINDYGISQLITIDGFNKSDPHVDPHYFVSGEMTLESDIYSFGIILLQLLTRRPVSGILRDVKCALENDNISAVLDNSAGDWPVTRGKKLANIAIRCCKKNPMNRPDLAVVLRFMDRMKSPEVPSSEPSSYANQKVPRRPPSHYLCPIFQEVMKDPLIAADGFTYEAEAIREWLANGHDTSPMTNLKMEDCNLIPNHALHLAIQDWQNQWYLANQSDQTYLTSSAMENFIKSPSLSLMDFTYTGINRSDNDLRQWNYSSLDSDFLHLRSQIFESNYLKTDLIRLNYKLSNERDALRRRNWELEAGLLEAEMIREEMKRDLEVSRERVSELEGETKDKSILLSKISESVRSMEDCLSRSIGYINDEEGGRGEELETEEYTSKSTLELVKEVGTKVETFIGSMEKKKMELSRSVEFLEEENRDINVLLRAALSEKQAAEKQLKETNEQKKSALLQIAERGLQRIGFGFGFTDSVPESSEMDAKNKGEEEENGVVIAIEKTMKNLRQEISQLKISLDDSRLDEERVKKFSKEQAQKLEETAVYINKLQNRERFLTQNVEELVKVIREAESEVSRWREACELEVEAGQREVELRDQFIMVLKAEVEKLRSALAISEGKLKLKEELAKAAMIAEEAAERSLRLAERRKPELLSRIEHLYRQLEEAESTERRRGKFRYVWCWPLWRSPTAAAAAVTASGSSSYISNRALLRYDA